MESGIQNGVRSNLDGVARVNGVNGGFVKTEPFLDKGKGIADKGNFPMANGGHAANNIVSSTMDIDSPAQDGTAPAGSKALIEKSAMDLIRMDALPDEIQHITTGIMPLGLLLSRLAQISHNHLQDVIAELSTRPIAQNPAANGTPDFRNTTAEDTSPESLEKKRLLLNFIQDLHAKWVKALVITDWSTKSDLVGKLIDLKQHLHQQLDYYPAVLWEMANVKRDLVFARLPSPDLKTALEILSSGEVSWMPELGYIEPPPLSPEDQLEWVENLNTILSVRLTLDEYDKIPYHFRHYTVDSARVTFKVEGEFEVDLTIADDDFEKQFWFIDLRFSFNPAPTQLTEATRTFLEVRLNDILGTDGLHGCYKFLHEFTLTHKITELTRQALELSRGRWVDALKIERLNRAMSIQYWRSRPNPSLKSWIIFGVHSGQDANGPQGDPARTSFLSLRWFRDNKEVKDHGIQLDSSDISVERILKTVIARHVDHILSSIYTKLSSFPRFSKHEASLQLTVSEEEPADSQLVMRLSHDDNLTARVEPISGAFALSPPTRLVLQGERHLNTNGKDPVDEGHIVLEKTRCVFTIDELTRRGKSMGWVRDQPGVKADELKPYLNTREAPQMVWIRRVGWKADWSVLVTLSLSGDKWWLVQTADTPTGRRIRSFTPIHITGQPRLTEEFFHDLNVFTTGLISQLIHLKVLQERRIKHIERRQNNDALLGQITLPAIFIRLSEIAPSLAPKTSGMSWARDYVRLTFRGAQQFVDGNAPPQAGDVSQPSRGPGTIKATSEAMISVMDKAKFKDLKGNVDSDVTFNPRLGQFVLRLRHDVGTSLIDTLANRLQAICRLVDFVDAMRKSGDGIVCKSVTMREVVFTYGDDLLGGQSDGTPPSPHKWTAHLDLASGPNIQITLNQKNPHLRVLDLLEELANSSKLRELPDHLKRTFSMLKALEGIEDSWAKVAENNDGSVDIRHWSLDYASLQYTLPGNPNQPRQLKLALSYARRAGCGYWFLGYLNPSENAVRQDDEFYRVLKPIFDGRGEQWKGLGTGAAGVVGKGIETLLSTVDNAVLSLVGSSPPPPPPVATAGKSESGPRHAQIEEPPLKAPVPRQSLKQGQSQPGAGGQNQNQSGGGRTGSKGSSAIVVID